MPGEKAELTASDYGKDDVNCLVFAVRPPRRTKLKLSCGMLRHHVKNSLADVGTMARLFGTAMSTASIRSVLEFRLAQIRSISARLTRLVERAIEDIPDSPDDCLNNLTTIEDEALDLIWKHEFNNTKTVPNPIVAYWTLHPRDKNRPFRHDVPERLAGPWRPIQTGPSATAPNGLSY